MSFKPEAGCTAWWVQTADRAPKQHTDAGCRLLTEKGTDCVVEYHDGAPYRRCLEYSRLLRQCPGRPAEILQTREKESLEPCESSAAESSSHQVYAPGVGQMFDDFFHYAAELNRDLGVDAAGTPDAKSSSRPVSKEGFLSSMFSWRSQADSKGNGNSNSSLYKDFAHRIQQI